MEERESRHGEQGIPGHRLGCRKEAGTQTEDRRKWAQGQGRGEKTQEDTLMMPTGRSRRRTCQGEARVQHPKCDQDGRKQKWEVGFFF